MLQRLAGVLAVVVFLTGLAGCRSAGTASVAELFDFEHCRVGGSPCDFRFAQTGPGEPGDWIVVAEPGPAGGEKVLMQVTADPVAGRFPLCVHSSLTARDLTITTAFRPVSGTVDQAGGLVVRYQDANNYYVVRANALENNVRFYKVIDGRRTQLGGKDVAVAAGKWQTLSLTARGGNFRVAFEGPTLFEVEDQSIKDAGLVGFWTKADSVTQFDNLTVQVLDSEAGK